MASSLDADRKSDIVGVSDSAIELQFSLKGDDENLSDGEKHDRDSMDRKLTDDESVVGLSSDECLVDRETLNTVNGFEDGECSENVVLTPSISSINR